ncbi:hypothetical protein [Clostridium tarantellae]|uniref:VCBS repeat-containing protein n=1 Tax=Clostridium tarantellae TaxID=39493 RepID=A0A6I1MIS3_9CLOT|nr:hypothetical protein [Clostridium tarantellae]MPQ43436.1 hypothetical protein [Clostridium tarantellae]
MNSKINLMNIAMDFLPINGGTDIKSINKDSLKSKFRNNEDEEIIIIEYIYNNKEYTMILVNNNDEWEISRLYNYINLDEDEDNSYLEEESNMVEDVDRTIEDNMMNGRFIVDFIKGDITGDKNIDKIYLTSVNKPDKSGFVDDLELVIVDGKMNDIKKFTLPANTGYNAKLNLYDFNGDGVKDIYICMISEGSGKEGFYYIYSYKNRVLKNLFDFEKYNKNNKFEAKYLDYYKVEVISKECKLKYIIDISQKEKKYLKLIYNENGTLKQSNKAMVLGISVMYPVDIDNNHVYELYCFNRIVGINTNDTLAYIETYLKWDGDEFEPIAQNLAISGMDID